tara:strand:- start:855 stop:1136 length:282 start_codon:yes stop_codon:yes gene_type:complete
MYDRTRYDDVPSHLLDGLERYGEHGIRTGRFLQSVLENNLVETIVRADTESRVALLSLVRFVWNEMPAASVGSPAKVEEWIKTPGGRGDNADD